MNSLIEIIRKLFFGVTRQELQARKPLPSQRPQERPIDVLRSEPIAEPVTSHSDSANQASGEFKGSSNMSNMQSFPETTVTLKRGLLSNSSGTIGALIFKGAVLCHILEDPVRPDGVKIYGETAIPAGRYQVVMARDHGRSYKNAARWSWHDQEVFHLLDVENFTFVQIHPGNYPKDTLGCLLPGKWNGRSISVSQSVQAYKKLYELLGPIARAEQLFIEIIDGA